MGEEPKNSPYWGIAHHIVHAQGLALPDCGEVVFIPFSCWHESANDNVMFVPQKG